MIELRSDELLFTFPEVHPQAKLRIGFQRTLRIPDDDRTYPLPPGLGKFPLLHVDDYAESVPDEWLRRGGVLLPMYQSEAMWLSFDTSSIDKHWAAYPFAVKIATGKQCAVSGLAWHDTLRRNPQDYMVVPAQPWLDGFVVEKGLIRQFVAMPLGSGFSAEEQLTGHAEYGGIQVSVFPMKREVFERRFSKRSHRVYDEAMFMDEELCLAASPCMGLAPGGSMRQEIYEDPYDFSDWQTNTSSRCFVHLCNSMVWQSITGRAPPQPCPTAKCYSKAGLPWVEYYDDTQEALKGAGILSKLKSVVQISHAKGKVVLPENDSATPEEVIELRASRKRGQVREGNW